jgi:hypothetical protein
MTLLTRDKKSVEAQLVKANSVIKQMQESMRSEQNDRLKADLNQSENSIALKSEEFTKLNSSYNESIKMLDDLTYINLSNCRVRKEISD